MPTIGNPAIVALIGYMGSGKTSVGARVATSLGRRFVDLDAHIEERCGLTVARIFADCGAERFRKIERQELARLCRNERGIVLATGGGIVCHADNRRRLRIHTLCFFLQVPPDELWRRLDVTGQAQRRPLFQPHDYLAMVRHWQARRHLYQQTAHRRLEATGPIERVAGAIVAAMAAAG